MVSLLMFLFMAMIALRMTFVATKNAGGSL